MTTKDEALKLALKALERQIESIKQMPIARRENGMVVFAVPEAAWVGLTCCVNDMRQALAEQQSGIKQVIELYDSPEQPSQQQEPVACKTLCELCIKRGYIFCANAAQTTPIPSPPASKPWVGLTDEEIDECYYWKDRQWTTDELVRYVEAKLREKNA